MVAQIGSPQTADHKLGAVTWTVRPVLLGRSPSYMACCFVWLMLSFLKPKKAEFHTSKEWNC